MRSGKYHARRTVIDGIVFDSRAEAERWVVLKALEREGVIANLRRQIPFKLEINGVMICRYVADFCYDQAGVAITEDVKAILTPVYRLKKKLMRILLGIEIHEHNVRTPRKKKPRPKRGAGSVAAD